MKEGGEEALSENTTGQAFLPSTPVSPIFSPLFASAVRYQCRRDEKTTTHTHAYREEREGHHPPSFSSRVLLLLPSSVIRLVGHRNLPRSPRFLCPVTLREKFVPLPQQPHLLPTFHRVCLLHQCTTCWIKVVRGEGGEGPAG